MPEYSSNFEKRRQSEARQHPPLILIGGGGHCRSVIEAIESIGGNIAGILDLTGHVGEYVFTYPVTGTDPDIPLLAQDNRFVITLGHLGNPGPRVRLRKMVELCKGRLATVTASTSHVSPHTDIGDGTVILHHATVNAGAIIGANCIINTGAILEHDVRVEADVHISTGAIINGGAFVGAGSFIGSGAVVGNGVVIGANVLLGAGSVTVRDLLEPGVYYGSPARLRRRL